MPTVYCSRNYLIKKERVLWKPYYCNIRTEIIPVISYYCLWHFGPFLLHWFVRYFIFCGETFWPAFFFFLFLPPSLSLSSFFLSFKRNQLLSHCFKICMCCLLHNFEYEMASSHEKLINSSNTRHLKNIFLNTTVELDCMKYNLQTGNWNKFQSMLLNTQVLGSVTGSCERWVGENPVWKIIALFLHLLRSCAKSIKGVISFNPHNHSKK